MTSASDAEMEAAFKRCRYVTEVPGVDTQTVIKEYDRFAVYYDKVSVRQILVISRNLLNLNDHFLNANNFLTHMYF